MNDRHPSGTATPPAPASDAASATFASYGHQEAPYGDFTTYDGYGASGFDAGAATGHQGASFASDPLFGSMPGSDASGSYDASQWGGGQQNGYDPYAGQQQNAYGTGGYDSNGWATGYDQLGEIPAQAPGPEASGQWDSATWAQAEQHSPQDQLDAQDATQQWTGAQHFATGAYDATQWNNDGTPVGSGHEGGSPDASDGYDHPAPDGYEPTSVIDPVDHHAPTSVMGSVDFHEQATATFEHVHGYSPDQPPHADDESDGQDDAADRGAPLLDDEEETSPHGSTASATGAAAVPGGRAAARAASRSSRRRTPAKRPGPAKRSALLTVAVPSACVMGVAGIAAASVGSAGDVKETATTASDTATAVKPSAANNKLDTQLESLSAGADDFADRASRTQERIDLKAQQEADKKRAAAEAARKERLRPKYALPVAKHGLSAHYGQSGVNWMSQHTGIDFPVSYGTPVMAATDGTVRTQWNSAYGNMVIVTAKDGTETWYCHLSTYKVPSGTAVKAGDVIAFSGNSGNSTGPHLHFEVRPAGGSAIDPLPWLRSHGIDPS